MIRSWVRERTLAIYSVSEREQALVISVRGALDYADAPVFRDQIDRIGFASVNGVLIVDLSRLERICSAGMRVLTQAHHLFALRDRRLIVTGLHGTVLETFEIGGIDTLIETAPTVNAALARTAKERRRVAQGI